MRNSDNDKWDLTEFKQLGKNSKYLHGYLFDVSDNAGFCSYDSDELINYLKQGRKKTLAETASEAEQYLSTKKG